MQKLKLMPKLLCFFFSIIDVRMQKEMISHRYRITGMMTGIITYLLPLVTLL